MMMFVRFIQWMRSTTRAFASMSCGNAPVTNSYDNKFVAAAASLTALRVSAGHVRYLGHSFSAALISSQFWGQRPCSCWYTLEAKAINLQFRRQVRAASWSECDPPEHDTMMQRSEAITSLLLCLSSVERLMGVIFDMFIVCVGCVVRTQARHWPYPIHPSGNFARSMCPFQETVAPL